ncbi:MAG: hypothetical protein WA874_05755 [Chryseosolibacter sp.]
MKNIIYFSLILTAVTIADDTFAQTVNWRSLQEEQKHIVNLNAGWDYASTFGIGYGYKLNTKIPLIIGTEFSLPAGEDLLDDFKTKAGIQAEVFRSDNFAVSVKIQGIYRRYQSDFVTMGNFGSEFSAALGYYKTRWYAATELGFDKSIVTKVRHSALMQEYYPEIRDGWYIPSGGNFFYGLQAGYSFPSYDIYLKTGKIITEDFKTKPSIPFYFNIGVNKRF